jgi:hypothetical protein
VRPLAVAFIESAIESFVDAAQALGLHAIHGSHDPGAFTEVEGATDVHAEEATAAHVEKENAA